MTLSIRNFSQVRTWLTPGHFKRAEPALWWKPGDVIVVQVGVNGDTTPTISNPHLSFRQAGVQIDEGVTMATFVASAGSSEANQYVIGTVDNDDPWGFAAYVVHDEPPRMRWWKRLWLKLRRRYWRTISAPTVSPPDSRITATRSMLKPGETDEFGWTLNEDGDLLTGPPLTTYEGHWTGDEPGTFTFGPHNYTGLTVQPVEITIDPLSTEE